MLKCQLGATEGMNVYIIVKDCPWTLINGNIFLKKQECNFMSFATW